MSDNFLGLFGAMIGGGSFLFYYGFQEKKELQLIENTPTSKVRSLAMGRVEVYGSVHPFNNVLCVAPFSNAECVYCVWSVEEYKRFRKRDKWVTIKSGSFSEPFYLKDNTGKVIVDPKNAKLNIKVDNNFSAYNLPDSARVFLEKEKVNIKGFLGIKKRLRVKESYLVPSDMVYIMGTAGDNPFVEDGSSAKNENDIMIQKGKKDSFFYISDKSEKEILNSFFWTIYGGLYGGSGLILLGLLFIFAYLRIL